MSFPIGRRSLHIKFAADKGADFGRGAQGHRVRKVFSGSKQAAGIMKAAIDAANKAKQPLNLDAMMVDIYKETRECPSTTTVARRAKQVGVDINSKFIGREWSGKRLEEGVRALFVLQKPNSGSLPMRFSEGWTHELEKYLRDHKDFPKFKVFANGVYIELNIEAFNRIKGILIEHYSKHFY